MSSEQPHRQDADQETTLRPQNSSTKRDKSSAGSDPDVLLDSPQLSSDEIELEIEDLDLAKIVRIGKVKANISGLDAQLLLEVRLKKVVDLADRLLDSVDRGLDQVSDLIDDNPETLESVAQVAGNLLGEVLGNGSEGSMEQREAGQQSNGTVSETVNGEGQTVRRTVDESRNIIETTLNESGEVLDERVVANLEDLLVEEEFFNEEGLIVSRMRDETGFVVEGLSDQEGDVIDVNSV